MKNLKHPNIVQYKTFTKEKDGNTDKFHLIMELI